MKRLKLAAALTLLCLLLAGCGKKYTVSFDLNGGKLVSGETEQIVAAGEAAQAPEVENGYLALRWDTDFSEIRSDTAVKAVWEKAALKSDDLQNLVTSCSVTVSGVYVDGSDFSGGGVFVDRDGGVLTSYDLINGAESIEISASDGKSYAVSSIEGFDADLGIALLRSGAKGCEFLSVAEGNAVGKSAFAPDAEGTLYQGRVISRRDVGLAPCLLVDISLVDSLPGAPVVNEHGELLGLCFKTLDRGLKNYAVSAGSMRLLPDGGEMSVRNYTKWFLGQADMSYSPYDAQRGSFSYSLLHTYDAVTGVSCLHSVDTGGIGYEGYVDCCYYYEYPLSAQSYEEYVNYLKSRGFESAGQESFDGGVSEYYCYDRSGILVDLFTENDGENLLIFVSSY